MRPAAATALLLSALVGCRNAEALQTTVCFQLSPLTGIQLDVVPEFAKFVGNTAQLTACWNGTCHQPSLDQSLHPSTRSVDQGCTPDGSCSATSAPTGGKNGFGYVADLPAEPVRVRLTIPAAPGGRSVTGSVSITPRLVGTGGPNCPGGGGVQGSIHVDRTGHVVAG